MIDGEVDYMKQTLDDMQSFFDGKNSTYDESYYSKLVQCMNKYNDTLLFKSQNQAWKGQIDYWLSNGTSKDSEGQVDHWGQILVHDATMAYNEYRQNKSRSMGRYNMLIYEPCNYVSNIAYYH